MASPEDNKPPITARHSFATHLLEKSVDIQYNQGIAGAF
jgi:site-specific recombinase XerD